MVAPRFLAIFAFLLILPSFATAAHNRDHQLESLFAQLGQAPTSVVAGPIEAAIWERWLKSGDVEADGLMSVGVSAMEQGDFRTALSVFDQLVAIAPNFAEAWNKRATVYFVMGNFDASVSDIIETLVLEPRHFGALSGLGMIYSALGDSDRAVLAFEKALGIHPHLPGARAYIAEAHHRQKGRGI